MDVLGLTSGMSVIKSAVTDAAGKFRIDGLPADAPLLIRADYKSVNYYAQAAFDASGTAHVEIQVYEPTASHAGNPARQCPDGVQADPRRIALHRILHLQQRDETAAELHARGRQFPLLQGARHPGTAAPRCVGAGFEHAGAAVAARKPGRAELLQPLSPATRDDHLRGRTGAPLRKPDICVPQEVLSGCSRSEYRCRPPGHDVVRGRRETDTDGRGAKLHRLFGGPVQGRDRGGLDVFRRHPGGGSAGACRRAAPAAAEPRCAPCPP